MKKDHSKPTHTAKDLWMILDGSGTAFAVFIGIILYKYFFKGENVFKQYAGGFLITGIICLVVICLIGIGKSSTRLTNKTGKRIYCKDEDSDEVFEVPDGGTAYDIDGFLIEGSRRVHKLNNGMHITVKSETDLSLSSLSGTVANRLLDNLGTTAPDNGWKPLFDKTKK